MRWARLVCALLLVASWASAAPPRRRWPALPTRTLDSPARIGTPGVGSPATGGGATPSAPLNIPVANVGDANCPTGLPARPNTFTINNNYIEASQTCATGANTGGYDVTAISMYVTFPATAADRMRCTVYT